MRRSPDLSLLLNYLDKRPAEALLCQVSCIGILTLDTDLWDLESPRGWVELGQSVLRRSGKGRKLLPVIGYAIDDQWHGQWPYLVLPTRCGVTLMTGFLCIILSLPLLSLFCSLKSTIDWEIDCKTSLKLKQEKKKSFEWGCRFWWKSMISPEVTREFLEDWWCWHKSDFKYV